MGGAHHELEVLASLLRDFGAEGWGEADAPRAFEVISDRSIILADDYISAAEDVRAAVDEYGQAMPEVCHRLLFAAHKRMYAGILTTAGRTRRRDDPGGGRVYFGGLRGDRRTMRFQGAPPEQIDDELRRAFDHLADRRDGDLNEARDAAVLFYAALSRIHPFYDGNGRAGRFVVSVYLHLHGWLVEWGNIDDKEGKFMKKINDVNEKQTAQMNYEPFLVSFWRKYVVPTEGLD